MADAIFFEQGKPFWEIARRYNLNKTKSPTIRPVAVHDMMKLQQNNHSPAVARRISKFIEDNIKKVSNDGGPPEGPRYA